MSSEVLEPDRERTNSTTTILCVDDDEDLLNAMKIGFRPYDVEVVQATDGMEGFGEALTVQPDAIVLDMDMPYGDGKMIVECLRSNPATEHTPIFILTGVRDPVLKHNVLQAGATRFLNKPCRFDELLSEISRVIHVPPRTNFTA